MFFRTIFTFFCMVLGYSLSYAIIVTPPDTNGILPQINENPEAALASIIQFFILITAILAVMAITWGGIKMILSTGDDEKMKKARYTIIYAFVGLVLAGLAYAIVEAITKMNLDTLIS